MEPDLSPAELDLIEHSKKAIVKYNKMRQKNGSVDTLYSFLMTESGNIYEGACYESVLAHTVICGERHAIANMVFNEAYSAKIKHIVVADPVPEVQEQSTPPCGSCRHNIWKFSTPETSILLIQYIRNGNKWTFPKIEKHLLKDIFPLPFEHDPHLWD